MNNLAFYLAQIYYNLIGQNVNPIPYGFTDSYYAEKIYRHIAGLPSGLSGGKSASFWLELWFYHRTGQAHRLATGTRPAWFWLSKLYASYASMNTEGILQPASDSFWAEKLLNILPAEISVTVNSIAQSDNSTFTPSNPILGTVVQYTVRATNNGTANLTLQNATRSGAVSSVTAWSNNILAPSASATCTITLDTATSGLQTGYFEFINNDPDDNEDVYRVNVSYTVLNVSALWALNFNVDAGAPLPSPYSEGGSTATLVQTDGQFSKSSGALQFPAPAVVAWDNQGLYRASTFTLAAGLVAVFKVNISTMGYFNLAYGDGTGVTLGDVIAGFAIVPSSQLYCYASGQFVEIAAVAIATDYLLSIIVRGVGLAFYIQGGTFTEQTLLFETNTGTDDVAPLLMNASAAGALDYIHVGQIAAAHALASGIKFTLNQASPALLTEYTGEDNGVTRLVFTRPGTPNDGDQIRLYYRFVSGDDSWLVIASYVAATTNYAVELWSREAGAWVGHISVTGVAAADLAEIIVQHSGNTHRLYTISDTGVPTKRGGDVSNSNFASEVKVFLLTVGDFTPTLLTAAPSTDAAYAVLDEV